MTTSKYILNHTFIVEKHVSEEWMKMITKKFFPRLRKARCKPRLSLIHTGDDENHLSYSLMVEFDTHENHRAGAGLVMEEYYGAVQQQFGDDVLWFTSLLEIVKK